MSGFRGREFNLKILFFPFLAKNGTNLHREAKISGKETRKRVNVIEWMFSFRLAPVSCQYHQRLSFFINVLSSQFQGHTQHRMVHRKTCVNGEITSRSSDVAIVDDLFNK